MLTLILSLSLPALAWEHQGTVWFEADRPLQLVVSEAAPEGWTEEEARAVFESAIDDWLGAARCAEIDIELLGSDGVSVGAVADEVSRIVFDDPDGDVPGGSAVITVLRSSGETTEIGGESYNRSLEADIVFGADTSLLSDEAAGDSACEGGYSFRALATRHLGHLMGLGRSCDPDVGGDCSDAELEAAMFGDIEACEPDIGTIGQDDVDALHALYGPWVEASCEAAVLEGFGAEEATLTVVAPYTTDCEIQTNLDDGEISALWTLSDGTTSEELELAHTFEQAGEYSIEACFEIDTDTCEALTVCSEIPVRYRVCGALEPSFEVAVDGADVSVTNTTEPEISGCLDDYGWQILDPDGQEVAGFYDWHFEATFDQPGAYEITLWVEGPAGVYETTQTAHAEFAYGDDTPDGCGCASAPVRGGGWLLTVLALGTVRRRG